MKRKLYILILSSLTICLKCNKKKANESKYPLLIRNLKLEEEFDRTKFDLYKLNSLFSSSEFIILEDSIPVLSILKEEKSNSSILKDEVRLKQLFGKRVKKFIEYDLEWVPKDSASIFTAENEITLTFSLKVDHYFRYRTVHTITYQNDTIKSVIEGELHFQKFPNDKLNHLDSLFKNYLSSNKKILTPWLKKFIRKNKTDS